MNSTDVTARTLNEEDVSDFVKFLEEKEDYLDSGLGVFHTDNHGNW